MKLTKNNFDCGWNCYDDAEDKTKCTIIDIPEGSWRDVMNQILKNQEDAEKLEEIKKLHFHDMAIPQTSSTFASFIRKQNKLQKILEGDNV